MRLGTEPSAEVTVAVTGHSGTDLTLTGLSGTSALTFTTGDWDTVQTVKVTADHDLDGGDDTVTLTHTAAGGEYTNVTADLPVTVIDDDKSLQTSATVSFANTYTSILEGATTTVSVQLSPSLSEAITVGLTTTNQSGATNADYSGVPASLEFAGGETTKSFTFVAETDLVDELDEVVVIGFGTLPDGLGAGSEDQATITIRDATSISISFDSAAYSATEGGSDATVTVELSAAPAQQVEVTLTATGHAGATSDDWSGVPSSLTFGSGETSKSFAVTAVDDRVEDDGEMVELSFGALPEGFVKGTPATTRVTLMNDDSASLVLSTTTIEVMEGAAGGATYTVRLGTEPSAEVTVTVSGQIGTDVSVDKATLTFTSDNWNTPQAVKVTAADDHDTSDDAVTLAHTASGGEYAGVSAALAVTVIDDDTPDAGAEHDHPRGDGGRRDRRDLHREAGYRARRNDHGGDIRLCGYGRGPVHDVPGVHHGELEHAADGDSDGGP